jgi:SAM-dependent methyltransferase
MQSNEAPVTPDLLMQLGMGFWASKTFLSAVELGVFSALAQRPMDLAELMQRLKLHERGARDFFDALVALKLLQRKDGLYSNGPVAAMYLDPAKPTYMGGLFEMTNARLYQFWGSLTEALRTGLPQNEVKHGRDLFDDLYADPQRLRSFLLAMTGVSGGPARALAQKFRWTQYGTVIDIGAAQGVVPVQLALAHPHLRGGGFDLPAVRPIFEEFVRSHSLAGRLQFFAGDFHRDPLPQADVLVMGRILHDWNLEQKRMLLGKAYRSLRPGGALIVYDAMIDDDRSANVMGLLMSLNMLIETRGGFDYTRQDCATWMREAGFRDVRVEELVGIDSMAVGIK